MTLNISKSFFETLNSHAIRYCHWKSNAHLEKALAGQTDLDVLVHRDDKKEFKMALKKFKFKKILSPPKKRIPGLEDYLGFDHQTGSLIHLHIHYKLILGQRYIKNHHLPIEDFIFENLTIKKNVKIPCPEFELILLVIRANMKTDMVSIMKHGLKNLFGVPYTAFPHDIEEEFGELIEKSDKKKLQGILSRIGLPLPEKLFCRFIEKFSSKNLLFHDILFAKWQILSGLRKFRRNKSIFIYLKYLNFYILELPILRRVRRPSTKVLEGRGKIFSLVGADGSGKSTLTGSIEGWLSWKLTVRHYYYGIRKDIFHKYLFGYSIRIFSKLRLHFIADLIKNFFWLDIARNRYKISQMSLQDIKLGKIVVTDRFPLKEFHDMPEPMDGPRLFNARSGLGKFFAKREAEFYEMIKLPDRIFVLQVPIEVLRKRKTDLELSTHRIKAVAVNNLRQGERLMLIDAGMPFQQVRLCIQREIWDSLQT